MRLDATFDAKVSIPRELRSKLEFGNAEQIKARKWYERECDLPVFEVLLNFSGEKMVTVRAENGKEAEERAKDFGWGSEDVDIDVVMADLADGAESYLWNEQLMATGQIRLF